jgi:hypothetical protein
MGLLDRLFSKGRAKQQAGQAARAADLARSRKLSGGAVDQNQDEQQATRGRMEAELEGQRERRGQTPPANP